MATSMLIIPIPTAGQIVTVPSPAQLPPSQPEGAIRYSQSDDSLYTFDGSNWQIITGGGGGGAVTSVNGQTGVVMLNTDDIPEGATNFYYTTSRLQTDLNSGSLNAAFDNLSANVISNDVNIQDNIVILLSGTSGAPTQDAGLEIDRGTSADAQLLWNETTDKWQFGTIGNMKNMGAIADISATSPIAYNPTSGVISLTTVPITLGGSGQTTANAALNAFLPSQGAFAGRVLGTDGTNTSWVPAGSPTGTPNTPTWFNALGNLDSIPNYAIEGDWYGWRENLTMIAPVDAGAVYPHGIFVTADVVLPQDTNDYRPEGLHLDMTVDAANSGFNLNSVYNVVMNQNIQGDGVIDYASIMDLRQVTGTGAGGGTVNNTNGLLIDMFHQAGALIANDINVINLSANAVGPVNGTARLLAMQFNGEVDTFYGIASGNGVNSIGNTTLIDIYAGGSVGGTMRGLNVANYGPVAGDTIMSNLNQAGILTGNLEGYAFYNNAALAANYIGGQWSNDGIVAGTSQGHILNQNGKVTGSYTGFGAYVNAEIGSTGSEYNTLFNGGYFGNGRVHKGTMVGINLSLAGPSTTDQDVQILNSNNQISTGNSINGLAFFNNANAVEAINGIIFNTKGNARTLTASQLFLDAGTVTDDAHGYRLDMNSGFTAKDFRGMNLDIQGTFTNSIYGGRISVNNAISTSPTLPNPISLQLEGGVWNFQSNWTPVSGSTFATGNVAITSLEVLPGSPITGDEILSTVFVTQSILQDTIAPGPIGLATAAVGSVHNLAVATGVTITAPMQNLVLASTVQNPGFADAGVIQQFTMLDVTGVLPFGGNTVVSSFNGIRIRSGFDGYAAENWGLIVEGSTAENYVNRLAINTSTKKVTDPTYRLDVGGTANVSSDVVDTDVVGYSGTVGSTATTVPVSALGSFVAANVSVDSAAGSGSAARGVNATVIRQNGAADNGTVDAMYGVTSSILQVATDAAAVSTEIVGYRSQIAVTSGLATDVYDIKTTPGGSVGITNRYGIYSDIDGALAKQNWLSGNMQLGGATYTAPAGDVGVVFALPAQFPSYTTTDRLALVVGPGTHVFDSTLNQMAYYNGTLWVIY